ncbi:hypothetical protein N7471_003431 [Penicillium samsonianum]|uniref:uncharacterized protein n=1 Tax=Penicillium samsonianum TaxID=1882272 RepID=UPI0025492E74|nr:uncharacterized protein N7471_003431 [Penicillium samsonianum]KAJ6143978.1 hypothetical protein N7471_003431 [Penicillium samsonianum]
MAFMHWAYELELVLKSASYRSGLSNPSLEGLYTQASRLSWRFLNPPHACQILRNAERILCNGNGPAAWQ